MVNSKVTVLKAGKETDFHMVTIFLFEMDKMDKFHIFMFCYPETDIY